MSIRAKVVSVVLWGLLAICLAPRPVLAQTQSAQAAQSAQSARPNIVVIYADDVGYGDVSAYGAKRLRTPRIDRLAAEGMRFTDAHSASATCTPSRYALLTGQYAWRQPGTGILRGSAALIIDPARPTLPRMLQRAGYVTGIVGKWHLGLGPAHGPDWNNEIAPGPLDVGFTSSFIMAATGDRVPTVYVENRRVVGLDPRDPITVSYDKPIGDWPTGRANPERLTVHPSHGHDQTIVNGISRIGYMTGGKAALWKDEDMADVFTRKAVAFLDEHRDKPFFLLFSLHDIHVPRVPHARFRGVSGMGPRGDVIAQMDWSVGEILAALDRLKLADRTLVIFTSDNGPVVDDGYKDDAVAKLGTHTPAGPFRGGKYSNFEAGTRVPWLLRWPSRVKPGVSDALISQVDLFASLAALTGQAAPPADEASDTENVLPALLGESKTGRTDLVLHAGALSLRQGHWKYIAPSKGARMNTNTNTELGNDPQPQLYDLRADPGERTNLAQTNPAQTQKLAARLDEIRQKTAATPASSPAPAPPNGSADERLRALYTEEWNWRRREFARAGDQQGPEDASDRFPKVDAASQQARLEYWTKTLATLDSIPFDQLSAEEKVNAQVFRTSIRALANDIKFRTYEAPFNADTFFWTQFTPRQGFATANAYRAYLRRLRDVPRYFDEQITNMRAGLARGYTVARVSVTGRDKTIEPYVQGDEKNPLYAPFTQMPSTIGEADQTAMRAEAATVIREVVAPAYQRLLTFIRGEYLPRARTTLAAVAMPDGEAYYQAMIEKFTTLNLTARQIHDIGLKEVARIEAEMQTVKERAGFKGSMAEFFEFLRTDPQFYAKTPRELLAYSAYVAKKADWKLGETIGTLPRRRHGIRPVPDAVAPIFTGGRGGLEACLMNTYNLPARPLYTLPALTLHECTPGHSFQAALALEGPERPPFRRGTSFSGYGEGWGLYTEWLGTVMGIYETPYEDFGRLTYEMWRACRLVIDTGIHAFGWTREQAMDYLRTRAALSEHEITTEVDRYIAWPAQALAYKLGEIQIRRHRREAEEKLGPKFDQRRFHDTILAIGSVPLPVLEERMKQFIADGGVNPMGTPAQ